MIDVLAAWLGRQYGRFAEHRRRAHIAGLCARGMRLGSSVGIMPRVAFDAAYPWLIEIGDGCRISDHVCILAHDATSFRDLGVSRLGRVRILHDTFIGERAIILPGVTIGPHAMIAAGSVVSRDVGEGMLVAGNPARVYGRYDEFLARTREAAASARILALDDLAHGRVPINDVLAEMDRGAAIFVSGAMTESPFRYNVSDAEAVARAAAAFEQNFGAKSQPS